MFTEEYSSLLESQTQVAAEKTRQFTYITERHLHAMWFEQKYFNCLKTEEGEPIEVISPGIWNAEAGPDFLKAHIKVGSQILYGDIELHLSPDSWTQHQHNTDQRYNQVILHISLWEPKIVKQVFTSQNMAIKQAFLQPALTIPLARIIQLIDLELYPYKKFLGSGRCSQALFRTMPPVKIDEFFKSAASWRLKQKGTNLRYKSGGQIDEMTMGIVNALGYKNNVDGFVQLFTYLRQQLLNNENERLAICLGMTGFFESYYQVKWSHSQKFKELFQIYKRLGIKNAKEIPLNLTQIRPLNHPIRRMVFLIKLLGDEGIKTLYSAMKETWGTTWQVTNEKNEWRKLFAQLIEHLPTYEDEYWNHYYLFEESPTQDFLTLMGDDLKKEILVNTFLPLLFLELEDKAEVNELFAFQRFYASLPALKAGKTKYLIHRFFGDTPKGELLHRADMEQGAYQLHHDFCMHFAASCEGCSFVDKYNNN